jgi:methylglutaconyl-CoA hydratase
VTKDLTRAVAKRPLTPDLMADMAVRIATARASEEGKEGVRSFLEKRAPSWLKAAKQAARPKRKAKK